jgi:diaminohydroxyphosphoribosylaminopyrimidine deaminase/5-amino-6-(5-phosphoribosylamino)uracil reductase
MSASRGYRRFTDLTAFEERSGNFERPGGHARRSRGRPGGRMTGSHEALMARALRLALRGGRGPSARTHGRSRDRPGGTGGGRGWHHRVGGDHAEVDALKKAATRRGRGPLREPGTLLPLRRTPPCTRALLAAGLRRVFIAHQDPNPLVAGQGIQALRRPAWRCTSPAGVPGPGDQRPLPDLDHPGASLRDAKMAVTLDGRVADREDGPAGLLEDPAGRCTASGPGAMR